MGKAPQFWSDSESVWRRPLRLALPLPGAERSASTRSRIVMACFAKPARCKSSARSKAACKSQSKGWPVRYRLRQSSRSNARVVVRSASASVWRPASRKGQHLGIAGAQIVGVEAQRLVQVCQRLRPVAPGAINLGQRVETGGGPCLIPGCLVKRYRLRATAAGCPRPMSGGGVEPHPVACGKRGAGAFPRVAVTITEDDD